MEKWLLKLHGEYDQIIKAFLHNLELHMSPHELYQNGVVDVIKENNFNVI